MIDSDVLTATYTIAAAPGTVETPTASPASGHEFAAGGGTVTLSCTTEGAAIYYTTGSGAPDTLYDNPISVTAAVTIKAVAKKTGMTDSAQLTASYTVAAAPGTVATPTVSPSAGAAVSGTEITLSCATSEAAIYYTLDGTDPSSSSALYTASSKPRINAEHHTLKAIAVKDDLPDSAVLTAAYIVTPATLSFNFIPAGTEEGTSHITGSNTARKIAYGNGVWVAVADCTSGTTSPGQIVYSEDNGATWNAATTNPSTTHIFNVIYGGDKFVAAGRQGGIYYSSNGKDWTAATRASGVSFANIYGLAYSGNRFILSTDNGKIGYSDNGSSEWSMASQSLFTTGEQLQGAAYGNSTFVVGGTAGKMAYSGDGLTWTAIAGGTDEGQSGIAASGVVVNIAYGGPEGAKKFVAVATAGQMAYSPDGITWTHVDLTQITNPINTDRAIRFVAWGGDRFLAGGAPPTGQTGGWMIESADGVTWTRVTLSATTFPNAFYGGAYGNGKFIVVDSKGILAVSNYID